MTAVQYNWIKYPKQASYKRAGTSSDAANKLNKSGRASTLRQKVLQTVIDCPSGMTADEIATHLGESVLSVRPRLSELFKQNKIKESGWRRTNASGMTANVWVVV